MKIEVETFLIGNSEVIARKVCEEVMEFYAEHSKDESDCASFQPFDLAMEIGDVFTALMNYCACKGIDAQKCVDLANTKNLLRGRYDTM